MEESQNCGHEHPLVLLNEEQMMMSNQSEVADCSRCGEKVSAPSFSCVECRFYLHKQCAEAPLEINHPFHPDHPLLLLPNSPYASELRVICDFCDKRCERFVYHCSCGLDFHIKCALFTFNIAQNNLKHELLEHVPHEDLLVSPENNVEELGKFTKCFACWEPLANYTYFSPDCGFNLHKKCADLPLQIKDMCHKHPLALQFYKEQLVCKICQGQIKRTGFIYCCSPCNFVVHIDCRLLPPSVEVKGHQHAFTLFRRRAPFICDACGIEGNYVSYICCSCNIIVHKKCISLPRVIRSKWHDHHFLFHTYFLEEEEEEEEEEDGLKRWDCLICHDEVNVSHGSYFCSYCNIIFHVRCVTQNEASYFIVSLENEDGKSTDALALLNDKSNESFVVLERNDAGEATKIKHFKHAHDLLLRDKIEEYGKCCDGCMLPVSTSFYYCSEWEFFLHKACAELPKMKYLWSHPCQQPLILNSYAIFRCVSCPLQSSGFGYECNECHSVICIRCVFARSPGALTCPGHEHPLFYYIDYIGQCSACGHLRKRRGLLRCKDCNFALCHQCFSLPTAAGHKCDQHPLELTYYDANDYSESHYCDICEEKRDPKRWFYHCAICDTSAHTYCVLGRYPFIKLGKILKHRHHHHPHSLSFVKKIYCYPECNICGKPCEDLALECAESECNYLVHLECILR